MWVVKLGGSLLRGGYLRSWIEGLARAGRALVVVPGGGPFADQVRAAQRCWDLADDTAHRMAILAMEQTAHLLCGLDPRLGRLVDTETWDPGECPPGAQIWFPATSMLVDDSIPRSWDVTSDSLAAILAHRLGAVGLVLVKSAPLEGLGGKVRDLQSAGVLDGAFHRFAADCGCPVWLLGRESSSDLSGLFEGRPDPALRVDLRAADAAAGPSRPIPSQWRGLHPPY